MLLAPGYIAIFFFFFPSFFHHFPKIPRKPKKATRSHPFAWMALSLFVEVHAVVTQAQRTTARRWAGELRAELSREIPAAVLAQAAPTGTHN